MSWNRPPLATLISRIGTDIQTSVSGVNAFLRRALVTIIGRAVAGLVHGLYGHQEYLANNMMLDRCAPDWLARWAAILGRPRKASEASAGPVIITGNEGSTAVAGSVLTRSDGWEYALAADATIVGGSATAMVLATAAGASGDCAAGMTLSFASPIAGINSSATVATSGIGGGADVEPISSWRPRVIQRLADPPKGGTSGDFVEWALEVPGVTRAWCYPKELGPGTVTVRFMTDDAPDGPFPDATAVAAVQAHLESVCSVAATPYAFAPVALPLNPQIHLVPDSVANRTAVAASLNDLLAREAVPGGTIPLSHFTDAIGDTVGVNDYILVSPAGAVIAPGGKMVTLGQIAWQ